MSRTAALWKPLRRILLTLLDSQGVRLIQGVGRIKGAHEVVAETAAGSVLSSLANVIRMAARGRPMRRAAAAAAIRSGD